MRLMRYNAKAEYSPGKTLVVSDALSPGRRSELYTSTRDDATVQSAIGYTLRGWPRYEQDVPDDMKELFNVRSQLSVMAC